MIIIGILTNKFSSTVVLQCAHCATGIKSFTYDFGYFGYLVDIGFCGKTKISIATTAEYGIIELI